MRKTHPLTTISLSALARRRKQRGSPLGATALELGLGVSLSLPLPFSETFATMISIKPKERFRVGRSRGQALETVLNNFGDEPILFRRITIFLNGLLFLSLSL